MVQKDVPPNDNLDRLARDTQQLALEKENNIGTLVTVGLVKRKSSGLDQMMIQSSQRL